MKKYRFPNPNTTHCASNKGNKKESKQVVRDRSHQGSIASESYPNMGAGDVMDCMSDLAKTEIMTSIRHNVLIAQTEIPEFTHRNRQPFFFLWLILASVTVCFFSSPSSFVALAAAIRVIRFTWTPFLSCRRSAIEAAALQEELWDKQKLSVCHFCYLVSLVFNPASINSGISPCLPLPAFPRLAA